MKVPKLPCMLFCVLGIAMFVTYVRWYPSTILDNAGLSPRNEDEESRGRTPDEVFYGIMFDAGSTGTRIHVYKFSRAPNGAPILDHETFEALKPGLSAYADDPDKVKEIFQSSSFLVGDDSVSIMKGTDEGIFAWITVNFLMGSLTNLEKKHAGVLDLGGGSTQVTFYPYSKNTFPSAPAGYISTFRLFNTTYTLYSHSYLGLGLMSARLKILGGVEGKPLKGGEVLVTPCLTPGFVTEFNQAGINYKIKGQAEIPLYESCYKRVSNVLSERVHKASEATQLFFYACSYYFDRAVDAQLIDPELGGTLKVKDFEMAAKKECKSTEKAPGKSPFLCMDLTYITVLLQDMGFPDEKELKLVKKIDNIETSWALGATFYYMNIPN
ncbi:hypothetical protein FKM82_010501 [Ascaphus truei]